MGYSGRPMVTITNNKNLIKERKSLFDVLSITPPATNLKDEKDRLTLYEKDQIVKRRILQINSYRKNMWLKNIISLVMLLLVVMLILLFKP
ncbi:hypothetical protein [Portibacter lacus]|uniref:Uncharacterized protein n=1 Tax=Portibacter lacus TaxID=1099794 RepID=A0AA37WED0_9BACT|nr:hypothetical protein [Portibacter lacus]GLR15960.1 hypothetical protein GCM10007940_05750 [Portibacter lacus]